MSYLQNPEKLIMRLLLVFLVVAIIFSGMVVVFWVQMNSIWTEYTNSEKIENLEVKVDNLSATTTQQFKDLRAIREFNVKKK